MNHINEQLISAIKLIADEKKIPRDAVTDALKEAITKAYVKEYPEEIIGVNINIDDAILDVYREYTVVEDSEELNDYCEISLEDAKAYYENIKQPQEVKIGDILRQPLKLANLPKKIVDHIMQIFKQSIAVQANNEIYNEWKDRVGEIVFAEVEKDDHGIFVNLENGQYGFMSSREGIPGEKLFPGKKYNFLVKEVKQQSAGWPIILSRADERLVKHLLTLEVPEIQEKIIEIVDIARVPGFKSKITLISHQPGVEPCGSVIGSRGARIQAVSNAINGERIEVIEYSDNFESYLVNVCSPAAIKGYKIVAPETDELKKQLVIVTPADQLALLIGKRGQNIQLVAKLLKADVDVKTAEEARYEDFQYNRLEVKSMRQRRFDRIFEKNKWETDYSMDSYNTPSKETIEKVSRESMVTKLEKTNVEAPVDSTPKSVPKIKPFAKSANISSTISLLDKIDNFSYQDDTEEVNESVEETKTPAVENSTSTENKKPSIIEQLKASEQARQQNKSNADIELAIDKHAKKKTVRKSRKTKAQVTAEANKVKSESILEQFKNLDTESILDELSQENENREQEEYDLNKDYDYEEK